MDREAFEKWAKGRLDLQHIGLCYGDNSTQIAFDAWQASVVAVNQQLVEALRNALAEFETYALLYDSEWGGRRTIKDIENAGELPESIIKARLVLLSAGKGGESDGQV